MNITIRININNVAFAYAQAAISRYVDLCEEIIKNHPDVVANIEVAVG